MVITKSVQPLMLCHYFEYGQGPFLNLSDLPLAEAELVLSTIRQNGQTFASQRALDYLTIRWELEERVRCLFAAKGGRPQRARPHYMTVGCCPWLLDWYLQGCEISIPLANFASDSISFTYGDTFPALRVQDGRPYRGQVYTLAELPGLIERYGLPQVWNGDGKSGPERYIEAQIWDDAPLQHLLVSANSIVANPPSM